MSEDVLRILLVEDSPGDIYLLKQALTQAKNFLFHLVDASRLTTSIDLLSRECFDLILLDLSLPDSFGLHTFVRMHEEAPDIPIVVLTGTDDDLLGIEAVQSGAQDYLVKGRLDNELLVRALRYAITRHKMQQAVRAVSLEDELTGLSNRRGFLSLAEQQLKIADRQNQDLLLIYADLDGMKRINDAFGHQEGDKALMDTAAILKRTFRESDVIARLGGDEFVVAVLEADEKGEAALLARLQQNLDFHNAYPHRRYVLEMSLGVMRYAPQTKWSIAELVAEADAIMYQQKRARKAERQSVA